MNVFHSRDVVVKIDLAIAQLGNAREWLAVHAGPDLASRFEPVAMTLDRARHAAANLGRRIDDISPDVVEVAP